MPLFGCRMALMAEPNDRRTSQVPSVDPSSTTMIDRPVGLIQEAADGLCHRRAPVVDWDRDADEGSSAMD